MVKELKYTISQHKIDQIKNFLFILFLVSMLIVLTLLLILLFSVNQTTRTINLMPGMVITGFLYVLCFCMLIIDLLNNYRKKNLFTISVKVKDGPSEYKITEGIDENE